MCVFMPLDLSVLRVFMDLPKTVWVFMVFFAFLRGLKKLKQGFSPLVSKSCGDFLCRAFIRMYVECIKTIWNRTLGRKHLLQITLLCNYILTLLKSRGLSIFLPIFNWVSCVTPNVIKPLIATFQFIVSNQV